MGIWLKLDEARPAKNGRYLITGHCFKQIEIARFNNGDWYATENSNGQTINSVITHWQPLPEKPSRPRSPTQPKLRKIGRGKEV